MIDLILSAAIALGDDNDPGEDCTTGLRIQNMGRITPYGNTYRFFIDAETPTCILPLNAGYSGLGARISTQTPFILVTTSEEGFWNNHPSDVPWGDTWSTAEQTPSGPLRYFLGRDPRQEFDSHFPMGELPDCVGVPGLGDNYPCAGVATPYRLNQTNNLILGENNDIFTLSRLIVVVNSNAENAKIGENPFMQLTTKGNVRFKGGVNLNKYDGLPHWNYYETIGYFGDATQSTIWEDLNYDERVDFGDLLMVLNDAERYDDVFDAILKILAAWGNSNS
tara:strand:+ start:308 stop:1144 length:837 start_codon:yes stop_codon:yes gene_type:complete